MGIRQCAFDGIGGDQRHGVSSQQHAFTHLNGAEFGHLATAAHAGINKPEGSLFSKVLQGGEFGNNRIGSGHK